MRIAIDGSHSVGKTTLFEALMEVLPTINIFPTWNFIQERARIIAPRFGVEVHTDWPRLISNRKDYIAFIYMMIEEQMAMEKDTPFLVDGSLYRTVGYANVAGVCAFKKCLKHVDYDLIVYCPIEFAFVDDGFRFPDGREDVDTELRSIISRNHRGHIVEISGSVESRIDAVLSALRFQ